jgi:hypothetical protein
MTTSDPRIAGSFRDPGGFLYRRDGVLYRQVNPTSAPDLQLLQDSGLYQILVDKGLLIAPRDVGLGHALTPEAAAVIAPEPVPFISYPYEWCFSQLKDAALATLRIQSLALAHGLTLKDASAFNIQFHEGRPVLIDTLSLAAARDGEPWVAYRQFCQHFLAPLALMAHVDVRLLSLFRTHLDGVPLDLASRLLPWRTRLSPRLLMHVHAHAASQKKHAGRGGKVRPPRVSRTALAGIVDSLRGAIRSLRWKPAGTEWGDYYNDTNYSRAALDTKGELVAAFLRTAAPDRVWDLGANDGTFSRVATDQGIATVAMDIDPAAVEQNWLRARRGQQPLLLPLLMDLTNPSPALGWRHAERDALQARGPVDCLLALALIHHLAIANNVPLDQVADALAAAGRMLIIEFVPKEDSQVQRLLASRQDVFPGYHREGFEAAFGRRWVIREATPIAGTQRTLYLMERRAPDSLQQDQ